METDLNKAGLYFGNVSVDRRANGVEIWAKLDPKVEELIKSACEGQGSYKNGLESFGRQWIGIKPTASLEAYTLERSLDGSTYTLSNLCGAFKDGKGRTNLSFLTLVGIGKPDGVRFMIVGPAQADAVKEYSRNIVRDINYFLREYLVPIHVGINITLGSSF